MIDRLIRSRVHWFLFVGFALFAIACTSAPTATPRPTSTPVPTAPAPPPPPPPPPNYFEVLYENDHPTTAELTKTNPLY